MTQERTVVITAPDGTRATMVVPEGATDEQIRQKAMAAKAQMQQGALASPTAAATQESLPSQPGEGFGSSYFRGATGFNSPGEAVGFFGAAKDLIGEQGVVGGLGTIGKTVAQGIGDQMAQQRAEGSAAFSRGEPFEGAARTAAGFVPVLGPLAADLTETATTRPLDALGEVAGMASTLGAGRVLRGLRAAPERIPRLPSQSMAPGNPLKGTAEFTESVLGRLQTTRGMFSRFMDRQQEAIAGIGDELVNRISSVPFRDNPVRFGEFVSESLETSRRRALDVANRMYAEIDRLANPTGVSFNVTEDAVSAPRFDTQRLVSTASTKKAAGELRREILEGSELIDPTDLRQAIAQVDRVMGAPDTMSFRGIQNARSTLLQILRNTGSAAIDSKKRGTIKQLLKAVDDDMITGAERVGEMLGDPDFASTVRRANELYREAAFDFNETVIGKMLKSRPETAHMLLLDKSVGLDDIARLKKNIEPEAWDAIRSRMIADKLRTLTTREAPREAIPDADMAFGLSVQSARPQRALSGNRLRQFLESMDMDGKLSAVFDPQERADLFALADEAQRAVTTGAAAQQPGLVAGGMNMVLLSPVLSAIGLGGAGATIPAAATLGVGSAVLGKIITSDRLRAGLRNVLSKIGESGAYEAGFAAARLIESLDPEDQQALMQAAIQGGAASGTVQIPEGAR